MYESIKVFLQILIVPLLVSYIFPMQDIMSDPHLQYGSNSFPTSDLHPDEENTSQNIEIKTYKS